MAVRVASDEGAESERVPESVASLRADMQTPVGVGDHQAAATDRSEELGLEWADTENKKELISFIY